MSRGERRDVAAEGGPARLLIVDDHAAVRAGLVALLGDEPTLTLLPSAAGAEEALVLAREEAPDVALVDVSLADGDGLRLCLALKRISAPPRVLLYTASADPMLNVKARLVGADGVIGKAASATELRAAVGAVLHGDRVMPALDAALLRAKTEQLSANAVALIGLRLEATPIDGIAEVLGLSEDGVVSRIGGVLAALDGDLIRDDRARARAASPWSGRRHAGSTASGRD